MSSEMHAEQADGDRTHGQGVASPGEGSVLAVNNKADFFQLFAEGDELYEAMLSAIGAAQRSIRLETFIFAADEIGWRFAKALAERARAGVDVRFHFDSRGSATGTSLELHQYLMDSGVKLKWFHPWTWWHPSRYFQRNHRKMLVLDEHELFLGGSNIILENSRALYGEERTRDTDVAVSDGLAWQAAALFDWTWAHPETAHKNGRVVKVPPLDPSGCPSSSGIYYNKIARLYALLIGRAVRRVYVTNPYFCPGSRVEQAMRQAAKRGVDVRLLVPRNSDPPFVGWLTRSSYTCLMKSGVRVYEYLPPRKLHAKSIAIDDEWSIIGSANLDHWGLVANHELVLVTRDRKLGSELRGAFLQDLERSEEVLPAKWEDRGPRARALEAVGWIGRKLL
jgi:cardiolipin synthase